MSDVLQNIDPLPPHPLRVYPPPLVQGEDTLAVWRGGGGSIVRKTPDTALGVYICDYFVVPVFTNKQCLLFATRKLLVICQSGPKLINKFVCIA